MQAVLKYAEAINWIYLLKKLKKNNLKKYNLKKVN